MTLRCLAALALVAVAATACQLPDPSPVSTPTLDPTTTIQVSTTNLEIGGELARIRVDDHPNPQRVPYRREDWPHWLDPDHNGCNARVDALRAQSQPPLTGPGCSTVGGTWSLVYVTGSTTNPADVDIDHVVALGEAHQSGGWAWATDQRARYANDPVVLWVVDDGANVAKSDHPPNEWRPANRAVWCVYGRKRIEIKAKYDLSWTTAERDATAQLLETC